MSQLQISNELIQQAERHLCQFDPIMMRLVERHGGCSLANHNADPFYSLVNAIVAQQLSSKAANTIKSRLAKIVGASFAPHAFTDISPNVLRNAGLSNAKARYIIELSKQVCEGYLDFAELLTKENETVIKSLTNLPGIGKWTAEMFLIFSLKRPDVLSLGDAGLQRAAKMLYRHRKEDGLLERISKRWSPYRSIASWYLWRHLDNT